MKNSFLSVTALVSSALAQAPGYDEISRLNGNCLQCIYEGNSYCVIDEELINPGRTDLITTSNTCIGSGGCPAFNKPLFGF